MRIEHTLPAKIKDGDNYALTTPLSVTGTAEELDAELSSTIVSFVASHLQLNNTQERAKAEMDVAAKKAQEEARTKTKSAVAKKDPPKPGPTTQTAPAKSLEHLKPEPPKSASLFDAPVTATDEQATDEEEEILAEAGEEDEQEEDELD
jgi:PRTRC genetic system protein E